MLELLIEPLLWVCGIGFVLAFIKAWKPSLVIGHWRHAFQESSLTTHAFYDKLESFLQTANIPDFEHRKVILDEGLKFVSPQRMYLRVSSRSRVMDICYAKYGDGFFVSWWLFEKEAVWKQVVGAIPWLGPKLVMYLDPITYYRYDAAIMFQSLVHSCIIELIDEVANGQGSKLSDADKKPQLIDVFKR